MVEVCDVLCCFVEPARKNIETVIVSSILPFPIHYSYGNKLRIRLSTLVAMRSATRTTCTISILTAVFRLSLIFSIQCVCGTKAFSIQSKSWSFRGHHIAYEEAVRVKSTSTSTTSSTRTDLISSEHQSSPILLLNGFGVGSFHQHRLFPQLIQIDSDSEAEAEAGSIGTTRKVYGIDYLGQGNSWPVDCNDGNSENEKGLIYSIDTWADQIIEFIEQIILPNHGINQGNNHHHEENANANANANTNVKVHLIGNSVGGYLSVLLAAKRPDLIGSICLLNATPVWGLNLKGWSGHLPAPFIPRKIGRYLFDRIRDINTIEKYLEAAYANRAAFDDTLMKQIKACTETKGGHAAFSSILFSPPATFPSLDEPTDFYKNLALLECDVLLLFGKQDPWCTPAFAKRMFQSLGERTKKNRAGVTNDIDIDIDSDAVPVHRYIELDNVGHCPNHEAPITVGLIAGKWVNSLDRRNGQLVLLEEEELVVEESWGAVTAKEIDERDVSLSTMERLITTFV